MSLINRQISVKNTMVTDDLILTNRTTLWLKTIWLFWGYTTHGSVPIRRNPFRRMLKKYMQLFCGKNRAF